MRHIIAITALVGLVALGACARVSSSDIDTAQPGTPVTVTMKDGSVVSGRLVQAKPDAVIVDPAEGGEWKTLARDQVASFKVEPPAPAQAQPGAQQLASGGTRSPGAPAAAPPSRRARRGTAASGPSASDAPAAAPEPRFRELTIPAETQLHVRLENAIGSDTSHAEDPVRASVTKALLIDGVEVVPAGSQLTGVVTLAKPSGRVKGRAELAFRFDKLSASGDEQQVRTDTVGIEAASTQKKDALKIGVPAAGGAIIGGLLGGKKGALIGGAVGGGAGTAAVLGTAGEEVHLASGSAVTVKLVEPVTIRVPLDR